MRSEAKIRGLAAAVWLIYLLSLVPLLILAFYNFPSADDINMGYAAHEAFMNTKNPLAALWQGVVMARYDYLNWMGYFTSTALMSVPPSVFGEAVYPAGAFILLGALTAAVTFFIYTLLIKLVGADKSIAMTVPPLLLFFMIQSLPSGMARVETIYWYCSGANYPLTWCLGLLYLSLLIRLYLADKKSVSMTVACCVIGFLLGGGNYMTALSASVVSVLALLWRWINRKRASVPVVLSTLFLLSGFAASCLAPGNAVREEIVEGFGPLKSIGISLFYTAWYCINTWTRFEHIILLMLLAPLFFAAAGRLSPSDGRSGLGFNHPLIVSVLAYGLASANITPPVYALGDISAGRLQALFYMQYLLILVLTEGYLIAWLRLHIFSSWREKAGGKTVAVFTASLCAALIALSGLALTAEPDYYTSAEALRELSDGSAAGYRDENLRRLEILRDDKVTDAVLDPYRNRPALLLYSDLDTDPENWINTGMSRYYHKNSVRLTDSSE